MLRDQRLRRAQLLDQFVHAPLARPELGDDRDPDRRGQRAQQLAGRLVRLVAARRHWGNVTAHRSSAGASTTSGGSVCWLPAGPTRRRNSCRAPAPTAIARKTAMARMTMVAPGAVSTSPASQTPPAAA